MDMTKFEHGDDPDFAAIAGEVRRWVKELSASRNDKVHGKTPSEQLRAKQQQLLKRRHYWDNDCSKPKRVKITCCDHTKQHALDNDRGDADSSVEDDSSDEAESSDDSSNEADTSDKACNLDEAGSSDDAREHL